LHAGDIAPWDTDAEPFTEPINPKQSNVVQGSAAAPDSERDKRRRCANGTESPARPATGTGTAAVSADERTVAG
jgi:hypothetical protein